MLIQQGLAYLFTQRKRPHVQDLGERCHTENPVSQPDQRSQLLCLCPAHPGLAVQGEASIHFGVVGKYDLMVPQLGMTMASQGKEFWHEAGGGDHP